MLETGGEIARCSAKEELIIIFKKLSKDRRKEIIDFARSLDISHTLKAPCADQIQDDHR